MIDGMPYEEAVIYNYVFGVFLDTVSVCWAHFTNHFDWFTLLTMDMEDIVGVTSETGTKAANQSLSRKCKCRMNMWKNLC